MGLWLALLLGCVYLWIQKKPHNNDLPEKGITMRLIIIMTVLGKELGARFPSGYTSGIYDKGWVLFSFSSKNHKITSLYLQ